ncbi:unnamed protein product [Sphenostylis stenocarpa]|uniref:Uncharacterized protein n=1 Tax=Sphenostylis stenocarpa TaxID=92480 RepID=A0AA86TAR0_9FABA|nr:unnamed protein product [Sphenostylis stenocarpa]
MEEEGPLSRLDCYKELCVLGHTYEVRVTEKPMHIPFKYEDIGLDLGKFSLGQCNFIFDETQIVVVLSFFLRCHKAIGFSWSYHRIVQNSWGVDTHPSMENFQQHEREAEEEESDENDDVSEDDEEEEVGED